MTTIMYVHRYTKDSPKTLNLDKFHNNIYANIFGHSTDKVLLNSFPYFITPILVFLFPKKF